MSINKYLFNRKDIMRDEYVSETYIREPNEKRMNQTGCQAKVNWSTMKSCNTIYEENTYVDE